MGGTFLAGDLMLFRGWQAVNHRTSCKELWFCGHTWQALVGPAHPCTGYYVPVEGPLGRKDRLGLLDDLPVKPPGGSTIVSPLSTPPATSRSAPTGLPLKWDAPGREPPFPTPSFVQRSAGSQPLKWFMGLLLDSVGGWLLTFFLPSIRGKTNRLDLRTEEGGSESPNPIPSLKHISTPVASTWESTVTASFLHIYNTKAFEKRICLLCTDQFTWSV